jgi:hypothetical protein
MKKKLLIAGLTLLLVIAFTVTPVAAQSQHQTTYYKPKLAFFYNATDGHLIQNANNADDIKMLRTVRLLDLTYDVTYYDLGAHPGYTNMARFAYGVTQTPTLSVLGPKFPSVASDFHDIVGHHSYWDTRVIIWHTTNTEFM